MDTQPEIVFYDGHCALCHGAVKFILPRDRAGRFVFAPLQGSTFARIGPAGAAYDPLPDSILVQARDGSLLARSAAVLHIAHHLGLPWSALARLAQVVPRPLRDWFYDRVASVRRRVFGEETDACPIVPDHLRDRFRA